MEVKEYDAFLSDVETRVDRLKALYEQYFQGIERLEPNVQRKDVERRMQQLFKEKPRNTALRFRYQTLVQRYTTFKTHWGKVARQIEEGTYRRDIMRARKIREQAREERLRLRSQPPGDVAIDVEIDLDPDLVSTPPPKAETETGARLAPVPSGPRAPEVLEHRPPPAPPSATGKTAAPVSTADDVPSGTFERKPTTIVAANRGNQPDETGRFPKPIVGVSGPSSEQMPARSKTVATFAKPSFSLPPTPEDKFSLRAPLSGVISPKSDLPLPPASTQQKPAGKANPSGDPASPATIGAVVARKGALPGRPVPPPPPSILKPGSAGAGALSKGRVGGPAPPPAKPPRTPPAPPKTPPTVAKATGARPASPEGPKSAAAARPAEPRAVIKPPAQPGATAADEGFRRVYDQYVDARRKNNESVDNLKYDTVEKQLRDMAQKHGQKNPGKPVEFEVVVRQGRVGVKPVVKK